MKKHFKNTGVFDTYEENGYRYCQLINAKMEEKIMAKSKLAEINKKIEESVVSGYKKIEDGVVSGYKKIENGAVEVFGNITDKFVDQFLTKEGESVEDAKKRMEEDLKKL